MLQTIKDEVSYSGYAKKGLDFSTRRKTYCLVIKTWEPGMPLSDRSSYVEQQKPMFIRGPLIHKTIIRI